MELVTSIITHWQEIVTQAFLVLGGLATALGGLYAIFLIIPGEQPDKVIKKIYDFTVKLSRK